MENPQKSNLAAAVEDDAPASIDDSLSVDDPTQDGWDTEAFHLNVSAQLKSLGQKLVTTNEGHLEPSELRDFFESSSVCQSLKDANLETIFDRDGILIRRSNSQSAPHSASTNQIEAPGGQSELTPEKALADLIGMFDLTKELRAEFKVFEVDASGQFPRTKQYVSLFGSTAEGLVEYFAIWDIEWNPNGTREPLIRSLSLDKTSANSLQISTVVESEQQMLSDLTSFVLGDNRAFLEQHQYGLTYWNSRIETELNLDMIGHQALAIGDFDGDLLEDIYLCQTGGLPNRLYRNKGDGKVVDVSAGSGADFLDQSTAVLFSDLDNDGNQDLVVGMHHGTAILSGDGQGKFVQQVFLSDATHIYSPTSIDYDLDGDLDLYLCIYYPDGSDTQEFPYPYPFNNATNGGRNIFLRNDGEFVFTDVTVASGLDENNSRFSYSAGWDDFDRDGDPDLYVANDFGSNNLFVNEGGSFRDLTEQLNAEDGNFGMSVSWGDFNLDGWPDIYISNMFSGAGNRIMPQSGFNPGLDQAARESFMKLARGNTLLQNREGKQFDDVTLSAGVNLGRWAWASPVVDLNNDGLEDILVGNGYITGEDSGDL